MPKKALLMDMPLISIPYSNVLISPDSILHDDAIITAPQAARLTGVSLQAMYWSIVRHRLIAKKIKKRWTVKYKDLKDFIARKCLRDLGPDSPYLYISQVSKLLDIPTQSIYHYARKERIKMHKQGRQWLVPRSEVENYVSFFESLKNKETKENQ